MSWKSSGKIALIGFLATLIASGCGSLPQLTSGSGSGRSARGAGGRQGGDRPQDGRLAMRQVGTFTGTVDGQTGALTLQPERSGSPSTRATAYGPANALSLTGSGTPAGGGILRGNVTLTSNNPVELFDVKAVLLSISSASVSPNNATGTTNLSGTPRPYWDYGTLNTTQNQVSRSWEFRNSGGVSFTFRVAVYANTWTYSAGDGGTLVASSFINTTTGWAVGDNGKLLKTTDGGATWSVQNAGTSSDLKDVSFINSNQGWAVGARGIIVATSDGGRTWRHQQATATEPGGGSPLPVEVDLYGVKFVSPTRGFAVGDMQTILTTSNGGTTWQQIYNSTGGSLFDTCFVNSTTGWAVGDSATVLRTTDGGNTWTKQPIPSSQWRFSGLVQYNFLKAVHFVDANKGWAVGVGGWAIATTDGGVTWTRQTTGRDNNNLFGVFFTNATTGWAVGVGGLVLKTTNGGASWTSTFPISLELIGVTGLAGNVNNLWITGRAGLLYYSTNGGSSWTRSGTATTGTLAAVTFADSTRGWTVGASGVMLRTTNGGASWTSMVGAGQDDMEDICFINASEGWAVGESGRILHTTNGGQTWTSQDWSGLHLEPGVKPPTLYGVHFLDSQNGWACGNNSTLLRTTDGGVTWDDVIAPVQATYRKIARVDEENGWIVGSGGVIIATMDGGVSWLPVDSTTTKNLNDIDAVSGTGGPSVWVVGDRGTLLHSTDGTTWQPVDVGETTNLNTIDVLAGGGVGWIAGNAVTLPTGETTTLVLRTTDAGTTWERLDAGTDVSLKSIHMLSANEGCAVGMNGTIKLFR